jgi:hypothetical protein
VIGKCRKREKVGETIEHVIAGCSSLSKSAYLWRHKIIHQHIAVMYKLLDGYTPPYCRYRSEPVLESANMILYWDRSGITDKTVAVNRPDKVSANR